MFSLQGTQSKEWLLQRLLTYKKLQSLIILNAVQQNDIVVVSTDMLTDDKGVLHLLSLTMHFVEAAKLLFFLLNILRCKNDMNVENMNNSIPELNAETEEMM